MEVSDHTEICTCAGRDQKVSHTDVGPTAEVTEMLIQDSRVKAETIQMTLCRHLYMSLGSAKPLSCSLLLVYQGRSRDIQPKSPI